MTTSPEDRAFHESNAAMAQTDPEGALAALDARYHDHLPEGSNCPLCGVEHAAINPSILSSYDPSDPAHNTQHPDRAAYLDEVER